MTIGIIGGGVWGSALAKLLSNNKVCVYARNKKTVQSINEHRFNPKLKYAVFNENVTSTENIKSFNNQEYLLQVIGLIKERSTFIEDILEEGHYLLNAPEIFIDIQDFNIELTSGSSATDEFVVMNTGEADLIFSIDLTIFSVASGCIVMISAPASAKLFINLCTGEIIKCTSNGRDVYFLSL